MIQDSHGYPMTHKRMQKETWCSPDGRTINQIDIVAVVMKETTSKTTI